MRKPLAAAASRRVWASTTIGSDKAERHNANQVMRGSMANQFIRGSMANQFIRGSMANQFIRGSMNDPPCCTLFERNRLSPQPLTRRGGISPALHLSQEPEEPRREAIEIDEDVARVGVGQTEPSGQRVAVLIN